MYIVCVNGINILVGVLFFSLCTTTSLYIHGTYGVYLCNGFLYCVYLYCVYLFLYTHIPLILPYTSCVKFIHDWMKTLGGVCICVILYVANVCAEVCYVI